MLPLLWPRIACRVSSATPAARRRRPTVCRRSCTCSVRNPSGGGSSNRSSYLATARLRALSHAVLLMLRSGLPRKVNTAVRAAGLDRLADQQPTVKKRDHLAFLTHLNHGLRRLTSARFSFQKRQRVRLAGIVGGD